MHLPQKLYCIPFYIVTLCLILCNLGQFQSVNFLQYICWDVNVHLSLNLNIMDAMDIVIDIVCLCVWFWLYVSQCLRSVLYFKVHLSQKLYCMPFLYCHTMSHIMPGSVSFIWQCICWDINVHLSLNVNGTHIFCWWMHWTLSVTLSVCVFDFASMLVNIYVVYCILKYICHRSYIAYHFYFFILCLILCLDQWILFCNIVAGMSMSICHWMLMAIILLVNLCNGHYHWHCLSVCLILALC